MAALLHVLPYFPQAIKLGKRKCFIMVYFFSVDLFLNILCCITNQIMANLKHACQECAELHCQMQSTHLESNILAVGMA